MILTNYNYKNSHLDIGYGTVHFLTHLIYHFTGRNLSHRILLSSHEYAPFLFWKGRGRG